MKVDKSLMNPEFEGYKLSLDSVPCYTTELNEILKLRSLSDDQVRIFLQILLLISNIHTSFSSFLTFMPRFLRRITH